MRCYPCVQLIRLSGCQVVIAYALTAAPKSRCLYSRLRMGCAEITERGIAGGVAEYLRLSTQVDGRFLSGYSPVMVSVFDCFTFRNGEQQELCTGAHESRFFSTSIQFQLVSPAETLPLNAGNAVLVCRMNWPSRFVHNARAEIWLISRNTSAYGIDRSPLSDIANKIMSATCGRAQAKTCSWCSTPSE